MAGDLISKKLDASGIFQRVIAYGLLISLSTITILPFFFMFVVALDGYSQWGWAPTVPPRLIPSPPTLRHFTYVINAFSFGRYFLNTVIVALSVMAGNMLFDGMAAYAFARLRFRGRELIFAALLGTMMIPGEALLIPQYLIVQRLGWLNSYAALIIPSVTGIFGIFLMRQFILSIPESLDEAAIIDGCSRWMVYWRIILPLLKPALVTLALIGFVGAWNNFLWPLVVASSEKMYTLQIGLAAFREQRAAEWSALMAGTAISIIPTMIVFISLQRYYVAGLTLGSTKG